MLGLENRRDTAKTTQTAQRNNPLSLPQTSSAFTRPSSRPRECAPSRVDSRTSSKASPETGARLPTDSNRDAVPLTHARVHLRTTPHSNQVHTPSARARPETPFSGAVCPPRAAAEHPNTSLPKLKPGSATPEPSSRAVSESEARDTFLWHRVPARSHGETSKIP